jgi:predicted RNA-binding protein YlxR (DUF448 family)
MCGRKDYKNNLLRIACFKGRIELDKGQCLPGRGSYICLNEDCFKKLDTSRFVKKIRQILRKGSLQAGDIGRLRSEIEGDIRGKYGQS